MHHPHSKLKASRPTGPAKKRGTLVMKQPAARASVRQPAAPVARKRIRHAVEIDEPRERVGERARALSIETGDGADELGEQLGETFVENITGADDAATDRSALENTEEVGGPFVVTSASTEFAEGTDESNPADADREAEPTV